MADLFDSPWKVLLVAVVLIVLFGSKKLPDAARSLGKSMRILKTEVSELHHDESDAPAQNAPTKNTPAPNAGTRVPAGGASRRRRPSRWSSRARSTRSSSRSATCSGPPPWTPRRPCPRGGVCGGRPPRSAQPRCPSPGSPARLGRPYCGKRSWRNSRAPSRVLVSFGERYVRSQRRQNPEGRMPLFDHLRELRNRVVKAALALIARDDHQVPCSTQAWAFIEAAAVPHDHQRALGMRSTPRIRPAGSVDAARLTPSTCGSRSPSSSGSSCPHRSGSTSSGPSSLPACTRETRCGLPFLGHGRPAVPVGIAWAGWSCRSVHFLRRLHPERMAILPSVDPYFIFVIPMLLVFGVAWRVPLLLVMLNLRGLLTTSGSRERRRVAVFLVFLIAAIASPSPDRSRCCSPGRAWSRWYEVAGLVIWRVDRRRARPDRDPCADLADDEASPWVDPGAADDHRLTDGRAQSLRPGAESGMPRPLRRIATTRSATGRRETRGGRLTPRPGGYRAHVPRRSRGGRPSRARVLRRAVRLRRSTTSRSRACRGARGRARRAGRRADRLRQDGRRRVRRPPGAGHRPQVLLHHADQGAVQPEVPRPRRAATAPTQVGLLTGDNSVNGEAPVVVMTTEVLRNMLYAGSPDAGRPRLRRDGRGALPRRPVPRRGLGGGDHPPAGVGARWSRCRPRSPTPRSSASGWRRSAARPTSIVEERRPVPLYQHVLVGKRMLDLFADSDVDAARLVNEGAPVEPRAAPVARDDWASARDRTAAATRRPQPRRPSARPPGLRLPSRVDVIERLDARRAAAGDRVHLQPGRLRRRRRSSACTPGLRLTTPEERDEIRASSRSAAADLPDEDLARPRLPRVRSTG